MTQRKCGTCRFYEVGTQQSHGRCRNPANPRRDDTALLRPEEIGCRTGWGVDFWASPGGEMIAVTQTLPSLHIDQSVPLAMVSSVAPFLPPLAAALDHAAPHGSPPGASLAPLRRQAAPVASGQEIPRAKEILPPLDPSLLNHPELGENGVVLRGNNKRSAVADAHKRALARREEERIAALERERALATEREQTFTERERPATERRVQITPNAAPTPPGPAPTPPIAIRHDPTPLTAQDLQRPQFELPTQPSTPVFNFVPSARRELPPAPVPAPKPEPPVMPAAPEPVAVDRHISTVESVMQEPPRESTIPERPAPAPPQTVPVNPVPAPVTAPVREELAASLESSTPGAVTREARYWDHPVNDRFERLRGMMEESPRARPDPLVRSVGRERQEPTSPPPSPHEGRTIRSLQPGLGATQPVVNPQSATPEMQAEPSRPAPQPPVPRQVAEPTAPPPQLPPPRHIDESLLRHLEGEWRKDALEAHAGQRCGTCRFFQAQEGGRGSCGCVFAPVHRRAVEQQELGCLNPLGSWWSATDDGWLERTERRPRRATPLLDALLREVEADETALADSAPQRRVR